MPRLGRQRCVFSLRTHWAAIVENDVTRMILSWFREHDGDGEFLIGANSTPYIVVGSPSIGRRTIYTTKPAVISSLFNEKEPFVDFGVIGRYGLPNESDLPWMRRLIGAGALMFLGDMDPVDLMIFVWLKASLPDVHIVYLGASDEFLRAVRVRLPAASRCSPCSPSERKALAVLNKVLPELTDTVGPRCTKLLERGYKVELDLIIENRERSAEGVRSLVSSIYPGR